jgi:hypothetical protein
MKRILSIACLLVLVVAAAGLAQKPAGVTILQSDKTADFSKLKTYEWGPGHKAIDPAWDKAIVAAIEKELAAKGLKPATPGDVVVAYHAVQREDVDLKTFDNKAPAKGAERADASIVKVGTLAIDLRDTASRKVLWRVAAEKALTNTNAADRDALVSKLVTTLFEAYPTAAAKKK